MGDAADRTAIEAHAGRDRLNLIAGSYRRLTGRNLIDGDAVNALWHLPSVVLAHGTQSDPLFFYANHAGLRRFDLDAAGLIGMPSRLSAEPIERAERDRLFVRVSRQGFIDDYAGVRISASGRRFRITQATVWNLIDEDGEIHGQAATFADWIDL
ncbi:MEKHLA domain-containing protein [Croceicoccus naphthovorans]|uniref:Uncharacterized protein n=1 Tax=Croceicoccus naphthovorans TaxID=1348774 RepID=A0A0G3XGV9_9SPHN|nr:MEKHLA domain-containing protein [Croceicoccus naphthovorans]AKM10770.1 hypothetical protein AB433_13640 [Croceicoccus naphthovorans]MBB3988969.1 hypothetical protein [Croceicoccus naphthovorans]